MMEVPLTRGLTALVDDDDYPLVSRYRWHAQPHFRSGRTYAVNSPGSGPDGKRHTVLLHRLLLDAPVGMQVDHINGDPLDNRRRNLRLCTPAENTRNNRTKRLFKGVYRLNDRARPYQAKVRCGERMYHLGYYATEEDGARAYDAKARELFGEFAHLNFPDQSA